MHRHSMYIIAERCSATTFSLTSQCLIFQVEEVILTDASFYLILEYMEGNSVRLASEISTVCLKLLVVIDRRGFEQKDRPEQTDG